MVDLAPFHLSPSQLTDIRDRMAAAIRDGLAADHQSVAALAAYLTPPPNDLAGQAIVVDTGGTNMRAAWVELTPEGRTLKAGPISKRLDVRGDKRVDRDAFFRMQAELVEGLDAPKGLPVGYCFSYPSEVLPNRDARLIKWTKGIDLPDVVDTLVGDGLRQALAAAEPENVTVLNDTVAALLAAALVSKADPQYGIGLIVGTGTNMACYASADRAPKLQVKGVSGTMAINLESGNFTPPHLTAADDIVDRNSLNPGEQRFEKALSGYYLPFIFQAAFPQMTDFDPTIGTQTLVEFRTSAPDSDAGKLAAAILDRSADMIGAGLAAAIGEYGDGVHASILAEGSLYWRAPGYAQRAEATLRRLLPAGVEFSVHRIPEANLFGAAAAALSR